jgi:DNA-binding response OmpR family regulator
MKSMLLVDNDEIVAPALQRSLGKFGFHVTIAESACALHDLIEREQFDLILVEFDLMPKGNMSRPSVSSSEPTTCSGTGLVRELRAAGVMAPIIIYSFLEGEPYETASLDAGADDFILKSNPLSVVLSRLHAHIRRQERNLGLSSGSDRRVAIGRYTLDRETAILLAEEKPVALSLRECRLLEKLAANPLRVFSQKELLDDVWGNELRRSPDALIACIKRLRIKMEKNGLADPIESVRGRGCRVSTSVIRRITKPDA